MKIAILRALVVVMMFDFLGFCFWSLSGQTPFDGFYVGAISSNVISLVK